MAPAWLVNMGASISATIQGHKGDKTVYDASLKQVEASQIAEYQKEAERLQNKLEERGRDVEEERQKLADVQSQLRALRQEKDKEHREWSDAVTVRDRHIKELQGRLALLSKQVEDKGKLLEARTVELHVAQTFLTKTDTLSVTEIKNMVSDLNTDIFQGAAILAEMINLGVRSEQGLAEASKAQEAVQPWFGAELLFALTETDDSSILQTALQGVLCERCNFIIGSWPHHFTGGQAYEHQTYHNLYQSIRAHKPQAVAGRWRSLTREQLRLYGAGDDAEFQSFASETWEKIRFVCAVTGCIQLNSAEEWKQILDSIHDTLIGIIKLAVRLRNIIGEQVTSCDFQPVFAHPGSPFDPSWMEEDGGDASDDLSLPVLCTTELGLLRTSTENKLPEDRPVVILKAKVALPSLLEPTPVQQARERHDKGQMSSGSSHRSSAQQGTLNGSEREDGDSRDVEDVQPGSAS